MNYQSLISPIVNFLHCETPDGWIEVARRPENLQLLLTDHLVCELKAAQTGMWLIRRYVADKESGDALLAQLKPYEAFVHEAQGVPEALFRQSAFTKKILPKNGSAYGQDLVDKMVLLIKEELHHFSQVLQIMQTRQIRYEKITASRYAKGMIREVRTHDPVTLIDKLICGAYIEARSCERFAKLAPYLDDELNRFYLSLLRSEARHYEDYLTLAEQIAGGDISERVAHFGRVEAELIQTADSEFRFHSGVPVL
ncbi:tRNA isopentenyl-2-thiomethyl-A-37 hydroxylase MiaE [Serratia sp. UGAL515B_01]|uniref:tRNA isopentenyl-2-thiomethyl-A-37 hydroxylase MiaE n=1 Tax=Serratia sp. UGAL515B_01 TaxID=2986763 RepID=UPI002955C345|nr:tRNA isopentenyl-2-thiomethyl-A-37 hydroxylase MiaE [Serratia sp. UGAL515B_01]WON77364.1 tRNA isopentenyl-2-thiomethyl-A-37 hydroxylase MiaE [Serratia sp. UGAL515B_01]